MPYTGDPKNSASDRLRLYIGDTDVNNPIFSDGEVEFYLDKNNQNALEGAIDSLYALKAGAAHKVNESVGSTSKSFGSLIKNYDELIAALEIKRGEEALKIGAPMYCGGISKGDKNSRRSNQDRVGPYFTRDMTDTLDAVISPEGG
jgi:hypothetical protein